MTKTKTKFNLFVKIKAGLLSCVQNVPSDFSLLRTVHQIPEISVLSSVQPTLTCATRVATTSGCQWTTTPKIHVPSNARLKAQT